MGRRISKEFLHPSILEGVNNKIGNLDSLETDAKGNMVQAINELVEKLDNSAELEVLEGEIAEGKELIANAVGEPLNSSDTFITMSEKITEILNNIKNKLKDKDINISNFNDIVDVIDILEVVPKVVVVAGVKYTLFSKTESGSSWADGKIYTYSIPEDFTVPEEIVGVPIESLRASLSIQSGSTDGSGSANFTVQVNDEPAVTVNSSVPGTTTSVNLTIGPIKAGDTIKVTLGGASGGRYRYYGFSIKGDIETRE
jgi:hypothetical protein